MDKLNFTNVRVRIAPSPTGFVHIGNLRTILYNYLFAKHHKGKFLIRIEDTDQSRLVPGAVENLLKVLRWAGIENDEGPCLTSDEKIKEKGEFGPYVQSKRLDIYQDHIKLLLEKNKAYYCFCTKERLDKIREDQTKNNQAPKYDNFCRTLSKIEAQSLIKQKNPYVIRFKMPENKQIIVKDLIRGEIVVNSGYLDDYVLMKSDGFPTYQFASVVDDHLMKITHILRGEEWIASTPKHVLLYEAFEWQAPEFAHLPQLLNKQKKKLSKRDGDSSVQDFIEKGYLKDALINFIALLGWNAGTEQELYTLNELTNQFSLDNVHKAGAVFDIDKLDWINGMYLRKMSIDELLKECLPFLKQAGLIVQDKNSFISPSTGEKVPTAYIKGVLALEQARLKKLSDLASAVDYFFKQDIDYKPELLIWKKSNREETARNLIQLEKLLKKIKKDDWAKEKIEKIVFEYLDKNSIGNGSMLWPMRACLSGRDKSPGPFEIAFALGKKKTMERLNQSIKKLQ